MADSALHRLMACDSDKKGKKIGRPISNRIIRSKEVVRNWEKKSESLD